MEVHFPPEVQAKLDKLVTETGRSADEFVQDAMAGYVDELADLRDPLDGRYDASKAAG
jgi:predicted DNA-binding protein